MPRPTHPGKVLRREIEARSWTQTETAKRLGWSNSELSLFISGGHRVNGARAIDLSHVFGTSIEFWLSLEVQYRAMLRQKINHVKLAEKTEEMYTQKQVTEITGLSVGRINYFKRSRAIVPQRVKIGRGQRVFVYTEEDLGNFRLISKLPMYDSRQLIQAIKAGKLADLADLVGE